MRAATVLRLAVVLAITTLAAGQASPPRVNVTVYYEALCPDSIAFFKDQLIPQYEPLKNYMGLALIPFGLAKHTYENNVWKSVCRHGPTECEAHRVQACALTNVTVDDKTFRFIGCLMVNGKISSDYPTEKCLKESGVDRKVKDDCSKDDANRMVEGFKNETILVTPAITSVPVITFNSVFKANDQALALTDFKKVLCSYIDKQIKPGYCIPASTTKKPETATTTKTATSVKSTAATLTHTITVAPLMLLFLNLWQ